MKSLLLLAAISMGWISFAQAAAPQEKAEVPVLRAVAIPLKVCATPVLVDPPIEHPLGSRSMPTREINQLRIETPLAD